MASQLFKETQNNNVASQFNQFKQDPMKFLASKNLNIPQQYSNDPHGAVQYLLNNGQMSQQSLNMLIQTANKMGVKF